MNVWGNSRTSEILLSLSQYIVSAVLEAGQKEACVQNPQENTGESGEKGSIGLSRRKQLSFNFLMKAEKWTQQTK